MVRTSWPLWALLGIFCQAGFGWAQVVGPPNPPESPAPMPRTAAYILPPVNQPSAIEPIVNPILDDSPVGPPGFFTNLELFFLRPHLNSHLVGTTTPSPTQADTVDLTTAGSLGSVLSPRVEVGYRLPEQLGEFSVQYQLEAGDRTSVPTDGSGGISQKDRLNLNVIDLDWGSRNPFALGQGWDIRFNVGIRLESIYYDTQQIFGGPALNPAGLLDQRAVNHFFGVGPEAGVDVSRELFFPGLALVGRLSGADAFGNLDQTYSETTSSSAGPLFGRNAVHFQASSPTLKLEVGLGYSPPDWNHCRFLLGYVWEEYWQIGRFLTDTSGDLLNRGLFFRAEFNF
jgi:Legionella pneumophila major outer membrane protein precursor